MPAAASRVVALSFFSRPVRRAFDPLRMHRLGDIEEDVEIIALRRQLQVWQRRTPRLAFARSSPLPVDSFPTAGGRS
jgi:hypothetical protein